MGLLSEFKRIKAGISLLYRQYVSPLAKSGYGKIGKNSIIMNNSIINKQNIFVDDYCVIQDQLNFISNHGKLIVGKYSVISSGCTIIPDAHTLIVGVPFYLSTIGHINDKEGDIIIHEDCWIGAGCILLPGCKIGRGAVIGAGSLIKKEVPPYAVVVGRPARIIATKFSIEQIIKHESILYPPNERMTIVELKELFALHYNGLRTIGDDSLPNECRKILEYERLRYGMCDYSK